MRENACLAAGLLAAIGLSLPAQVNLQGLTRLTRTEAKAQGRSLTLDGSIPVQDPSGKPVDTAALLGLLQGGKHTLDLYVDAKGDVKALVMREKTAEEVARPKPAPGAEVKEPLPQPTPEDRAAVAGAQARPFLEALYDADQGNRAAFQDRREKPLHAREVLAGAAKVDGALEARNQRRLVALVEAKGWPTKAQVGEKGMLGAFMVLQHAPQSLQEAWFDRVKGSVASGDLPAWTAAILEDRIRMRQNKPQIYGTQTRMRGGKIGLWAVEDLAQVEARRKAVGLGPLSETLQPLGLEVPRDLLPLD